MNGDSRRCAWAFVSVACFWALLIAHLEKVSPTIDTLQAECKSILLRLQHVCDQIGVTLYADAGTLLGAFRDKRMIQWDDDIDMFVNGDDIDVLVAASNQLAMVGLQVRLFDTGMHKVSNVNPSKHGFVDLFTRKFVVDNQGARWPYVGWAAETWPECWIADDEMQGVPQKLHFGGKDAGDSMMVLAHPNPIPYLERSYGATWHTPRRTDGTNGLHSYSGLKESSLSCCLWIVPLVTALLASSRV